MAGPSPDAGMPRWVKVFGIILAIVVLLFFVMMVTGGGEHGPGRHAPSGDAGTALANVAEGHTRPTGLHMQPGS